MAPPSLRLPPTSPIFLFSGSRRSSAAAELGGRIRRHPVHRSRLLPPVSPCRHPLARASTKRAGRGYGPTVAAAAAEVADSVFSLKGRQRSATAARYGVRFASTRFAAADYSRSPALSPPRARELFLALRHQASRARRWPTIAAAAADVTDSIL